MSIVCYIVFIDVFLVCVGIAIDTSICKQNFSMSYFGFVLKSEDSNQPGT